MSLVEDDDPLLFPFSLFLGSLLALGSVDRLASSSVISGAATGALVVSLVLEEPRTRFSLPIFFVSFSRSFSFSLSLSDTLALALVLCRLSVAFLAACRCGTIKSVVDLVAITDDDAVAFLLPGSLTFLPRPRPRVAPAADDDELVAETDEDAPTTPGEKALTAALVRTVDKEPSRPPRLLPSTLKLSSSLSV